MYHHNQVLSLPYRLQKVGQLSEKLHFSYLLSQFFVLQSGVEFFLSDDLIQIKDGTQRTNILSGDYIPTDGSGRLLITDISLTYGQTQTSDDSALFCHATRDVITVRQLDIGDWYLQPDFETTTSTAIGDGIDGDNDLGWTRDRGSVNERRSLYRQVKLRRVSQTAMEGKFTCHIPEDSNNNKYLFILYPSEYETHCMVTSIRAFYLQFCQWGQSLRW